MKVRPKTDAAPFEPMRLAGRWTGDRRRALAVRDPENGHLIAHVPRASLRDVGTALDAAAKAANAARHLPVHERMRILRTVAEAVTTDTEVFARLIATEGIKTIREARAEVIRAADTLRLCAEEARRLGGETLAFDQRPGSEDKVGWWTRVPAGVVLAITPFNDPLNLVAHKVGPALAAGNTVILKPHEATPLSALHLARAFVAAGLPDAFLQVITGEGREIGDALVGDPRVRVVSFTGGRAVGARLPAIAGLKRLQLELGGNAPTIVMPSADLAHAAESCASGAYWAAGQNCLHVQRIFVHAAVARRFRERFVAAAARRTRGPKLDEKTAMGPQLSEQAAARVATRVRAACRAGARLLAGGTTDGAWHPATVIERVPRGHTLFREEIFGPVTLIEEIRSLDEAVQAANATPYGLHAAIFTRDVREAFRATRDLDCGAVLVNESSDYRIDAMPFGGTKASGLGREGVRFSIDAMSEPKVVCFDMSARK